MSPNEEENWKKSLELYEIEKKSQYEQAKFTFDQSKTYNTVIMGLAYGGFFAIWSTTNSVSPDKKTLAMAGALMTVSLIAFVSFALINMYMMSKIGIGQAKISLTYGSPANRDAFDAMVKTMMQTKEAVAAEMRTMSIRLQLVWPWFFYISVATGFSAAMLLLFLQLKYQWTRVSPIC